jgi:hypothetical protein
MAGQEYGALAAQGGLLARVGHVPLLAGLDLMAQIAGMRRRDRWEDWDRRPVTGDSRQHVSVWEKV